jgi:hypothetical protein
MHHDANMASQDKAGEQRRLSDLDKIAFQHEVGKARAVSDHVRSKDLFDHQSPLVKTDGGVPLSPEPIDTNTTPEGES